MRRALLLTVVAAALALGAQPAAAGLLEWKDPEGDAQLIVTVGDSRVATQDVNVPIPSEPALDITSASIKTTGDKTVWTANIKKLSSAAPTGTTGQKYIFYFSYGEASYNLAVIDDAGYGKRTELRGGPTGQTNPTPCGQCIGVLDVKASRLVITTPTAALSRAFKAVDPTAKAIAPGAKLEKISVTSGRTHGAYASGVGGGHFQHTADKAVAPAPGTFTF